MTYVRTYGALLGDFWMQRDIINDYDTGDRCVVSFSLPPSLSFPPSPSLPPSLPTYLPTYLPAYLPLSPSSARALSLHALAIAGSMPATTRPDTLCAQFKIPSSPSIRLTLI